LRWERRCRSPPPFLPPSSFFSFPFYYLSGDKGRADRWFPLSPFFIVSFFGPLGDVKGLLRPFPFPSSPPSFHPPPLFLPPRRKGCSGRSSFLLSFFFLFLPCIKAGWSIPLLFFFFSGVSLPPLFFRCCRSKNKARAAPLSFFPFFLPSRKKKGKKVLSFFFLSAPSSSPSQGEREEHPSLLFFFMPSSLLSSLKTYKEQQIVEGRLRLFFFLSSLLSFFSFSQ